jgi:DNA-directed RNA polymerase beta subunit
MSISTAITNGFSSYPIIKWIRANTPLKLLTECEPSSLATGTKVFINGNWIGNVKNPNLMVTMFRLMRRNGLINAFTSIAWYIERDEIVIFCDNGRLTRPLYVVEGGEFVMFDDTTIELPKGSLLIFPSNFLYPHQVLPVTKGTRHAFVSWVW